MPSNSAKAIVVAYLQRLTSSDRVLLGHQNQCQPFGWNERKDELGDVHDVTGSVSGILGIDSLALFGSEAGWNRCKICTGKFHRLQQKRRAEDRSNRHIITACAKLHRAGGRIKDDGGCEPTIFFAL